MSENEDKQEPQHRKPDVSLLRRTYDQYGPKSTEFYEVVKGLIIYVIRRYSGSYNEELFFASYCQVLESLNHYDPKALNLASFIFSVVRNKVSSFLYHKQKRDYESEEPLNFLKSIENGYKDIDFLMTLEYNVDKNNLISMVGNKMEIAKSCILMGDDSFHFRNLLWNSIRDI